MDAASATCARTLLREQRMPGQERQVAHLVGKVSQHRITIVLVTICLNLSTCAAGPETAAAEHTDEGDISEPQPEQQSCLGHLLKDGCAADDRKDGLCLDCHKEYKKQFAAATTFLRWQLELAILGTRPSFTGDIFG